MKTSILEKIGLTKTEIKVYLALLELGSSSTGKIVDKSKASSSKIYEILEKLMQKGLASYVIKSGIKFFEAAPPERIMDYMKEREEKFNEQKDELKKILPELQLKRQLSQYKSEATIFKGLKGGETAFKHMLNSMSKNDEWLAFVITFQNKKYFDLLSKIHAQRDKNGIKARLIFNVNNMAYGEIREKLPNTTVKYVPDEVQTPAIINVTGNVSLINIMDEEVTVFMIESKEVADSFRAQFEKLWNQDVNTYKGFKSVTDKFASMLDVYKPGDEYYVLGANYGKGNARLRKWFVGYHNGRLKKGVVAKLLSYADSAKEVIDEVILAGDTKMRLSDIRALPPEIFSPMQINLYKDDKVLIFIWEEELICFEIKSKIIYNNFKEYFDLLWKTSKKVH